MSGSHRRRASHHSARQADARLNRHGRRDSTGEVGQLGADGELGGAPQDGVHVGVDDLDDPARQLARSAMPSGCGSDAELPRSASRTCSSRSLPVGEVVVERAQGVVDHRPVARPDPSRSRAPRPARAAGRGSRGRHRAGRRGGRPRSCRGRAPCRRSAPPAPPGARTTASRRCGRACATTRTSRPSTATTSPSPSPSEPSRYAGSSARTPQPTRSANSRAASEWSRW